MNNILRISIFALTIMSIATLSYALPAPCTQDQLIESSDYAIEGKVLKVVCGEPYDSKECTAKEGVEGFAPEMVSKCSATVKVTKNIKGSYKKGDQVEIPYFQVVQNCENGSHIIPGSSVKNFVPDSEIKYYNSEQCKYWNYIQLSVPPSK